MNAAWPQVIRLEDAGECPRTACGLPLVRVTYQAIRGGTYTVTVHDDGSFDGHPAWEAQPSV